MKIGLNAICIGKRPSGARQRFIGIYNAFFKLMPDHEFVIYQAKGCDLRTDFDNHPNVEFIDTPIPEQGRLLKFIAGLGYWRKTLKARRFDVFEGFHLPFVTAPGALNILTIHDIRDAYGDSGFFNRLLFGIVLRNALEKADYVITVSESMKAEIIAYSPRNNVSVIYNGIDIDAFSSRNVDKSNAVLAKFGIKSGFLLSVGHFEPRKNYLRLIDALALLHARGRHEHLVIVGNDSGEMSAVLEKIKHLNLKDHVTVLNGISDEEVRCLYQSAGLFVFPSYYEGFGIPILEAMAAGCPMVLSDIPVFREIAQDQATYFRYDDAETMARCIESALVSDIVPNKQGGFESARIKAFSFAKLAHELELIYRKAL